MFYLGAFAVGARSEIGPAAATCSRVTRNPPLVAAVAGLLAPAGAAPHVLVDLAHVAVWVMLAGGSSRSESTSARGRGRRAGIPPPLSRPVGAASRCASCSLRRCSRACRDRRARPHAYLLQAAMPSGINSLVIGHNFGLDLRLVSSAIAWTTAICFSPGS